MLQDLRYALRSFARNPGFTAAAVISLAIGIGANSAIFTLVNAILLHNLPVVDPNALVRIGDKDDCCVNSGWNDAGDAASAALRYFGASLGATRFAQIDPEDFFDFQATRPRVELVDGLRGHEADEAVWPGDDLHDRRDAVPLDAGDDAGETIPG